MRPRIYLAGPPFVEECRRRAAALLVDAGLEPIDPMRRDFRGSTQGHESEIVEGDLADIDACDAVLASRRSRTAVALPSHPWTVYVSTAVHADRDEAVRALGSVCSDLPVLPERP